MERFKRFLAVLHDITRTHFPNDTTRRRHNETDDLIHRLCLIDQACIGGGGGRVLGTGLLPAAAKATG